MKRFLIAFSLALMSLSSLHAQDYEIPKYQISISFFGEMITHSGIRLGFTTPISQKLQETANASSANRAWVVGGYLTYYRHSRNHRALMATASLGRQHIGANGFQMEIHAEAGYMLSILDGEAFEWNGTEMVESNKGSSHFVMGFNGGAGWNFAKKLEVPISFMLHPHLYIQAPYNSLFVPRIALEAKLTYQFN